MTTRKTKKTITNLSDSERRFNKIIRYHNSQKTELTPDEIKIAKKFFMIGWSQSLLHSIDLLEDKGME